MDSSDRAEHIFALRHGVELWDVYQAKIAACDVEIEIVLRQLNTGRSVPSTPLPARRHATGRNEPAF